MSKPKKYTAEAARLKPPTKPDAYTYLTTTSTDEERKAVDRKILEEYDAIFGTHADAYAAKLGASMAATKDAITASAFWSPSTVASPSTWSTAWDEFAATKGELPMNPFLDKVVKMEYVGSRITCNPAPTDTDEDVLLLTDDLETLIGDCIEVGFTRDGDTKASYPVGFVSLRNGSMNFIVTDDEEFYKKFMLATHVCKSLNLMEKQNRITVFQAIVYGNEYGGFATEAMPF
jgi:hypothetical protein